MLRAAEPRRRHLRCAQHSQRRRNPRVDRSPVDLVLSGHPLSAAVLAPAAGRGTSQTIAIIADRRLAVAGLSAVLSKGMDYQLVAEVRGTLEVQEAIDLHRPAVIIEAPLSGFPGSLLGNGQGGGSGVPTLVAQPTDRSDQLASSIRAAMLNAST